MLFVSCFGGTAVVNASPLQSQSVIENVNRPLTDIVNPVQIGDLTYNLNLETMTAEVAKAAFADEMQESVVVPSTVEYEGNTFTVTSLANGAFAYCEYLRFVTLPETLTNIEARAFIKCWALESINLPNSVKNIGKWAFKGCECLLNIELPESLETLGDEVFYNCPSLRSVKFYDNITVIPFGAFSYCRNISEMNMPKNLVKISDQAFYGCESMTQFDIPETIQEIGSYAFGTCISLANVVIPDNITIIKEGTYINCIGLTKVEIPEQITSIEKKAFAFCENLDDVTISKNVDFIGVNAFDGCSMSFLTFADSDKPLVIDNTNLTNGRRSAFAGVEISELYIGRDVQNFNDWSNEFLKKLSLGAGLTTWRNEYCGNHAQKIYSYIEDPTQLVPVFDDKIYEKAKLIVPVGTIDAYKVAEGWSKFNKMEEGVAAGIEGVSSENDGISAYYSTNGMRSDKPFKGLNIVKYNNGDVKKVIIK